VSGIVGYSELARTHGNAVVMMRNRIVGDDEMYCGEMCIEFGKVQPKRKDARRTTVEEKASRSQKSLIMSESFSRIKLMPNSLRLLYQGKAGHMSWTLS